MLLSDKFAPFVQKSPLCVLLRGIIERQLDAGALNKLFDEVAEKQYTRKVLFSTLFDLMAGVVFKAQPNIHAAYQALEEETGSSLAAIYAKLNGIETATSAALVKRSATDARALIHEMKAELPPLLAGYQVRILDGNCLAKSEHRLKVLRKTSAGALPGKSLVVLDPALMTAIEVFPCEDGHAQERSFLTAVLAGVKAQELWLADRNFCTLGFLFGLAKKEACFAIRQHGNLPFEETSKWRQIGHTQTGTVKEQSVEVFDGEAVLRLRRTRLILNKATRDGESEIDVLSNLPKKVDAIKIMQLYRNRWTVEKAFQDLEKHFHSEIETLAYPRAALFGFCVALVAYNVLAVAKAAMRSAHGQEKVESEISGYYLAGELSRVYEGMMIALPEEAWRVFAELGVAEASALFVELALGMKLRKYKKHPRGPKKAVEKDPLDKQHPHVSTYRLLAAAKK